MSPCFDKFLDLLPFAIVNTLLKTGVPLAAHLLLSTVADQICLAVKYCEAPFALSNSVVFEMVSAHKLVHTLPGNLNQIILYAAN